VNVTAGHVRLVGKDGNFEFEHGSQTDVSRLNSYYAGTGTRTPVAVGGADGQDVVALIAQASPAQKRDIQQWLSGSKVALAVDSKGRLRFGNITIWAAPRGGKIALYAQLQGAAPHVLASTVG
jgi:hypothetical protein